MDIKYGEQNPFSGYIGAITILILSTFIAIHTKIEFLNKIEFFNNSINDILSSMNIYQKLISIIFITFIVMLIAEFFGKHYYIKLGAIAERPKFKPPNLSYILKSAFFRWITLTFVFFILWYFINNHYYFDKDYFIITKNFFDYLF